MVLYTVYKVSYVTSAGSARSYIGYTGNVSARRAWHEKQPPAWMKPRKGAVLEFVCLETGIQTKECARAAEALYAARAISQDPLLVRGGPWVKPTLAEGALDEVRAVAAMKSYMSMDAYAQSNPNGNLQKHLQGLEFVPAKEAQPSDSVVRGASVLKRKASGTPGNRNRKDQLERGVLKRPSAYFTRVHRGKDPAAARANEYAKRQR